MKIAFLTFDQFTRHNNTAGTRLRVKQLLKYMPNAEEYIQGKKYDLIIFQKAYWKEGINNLKCKKILDICDPDYLLGSGYVEMMNNVDAITVSTTALKNDIQEYTDKPVYVIKDRFELSELPKPRTHKGPAKKVVWFGYIENIEPLEQAISNIKRHKLKLIVISNGSYNNSAIEIKNIKWTLEKQYTNIQKGDIAILPKLSYGRWKYKSNNRMTLSELLGVPVANSPEELTKLIDGDYRQKESVKRYVKMAREYNVKKSVYRLNKIIKSLWK